MSWPIAGADPHRTWLRGRLTVSWDGTFADRTLRFRVALTRSRRTAEARQLPGEQQVPPLPAEGRAGLAGYAVNGRLPRAVPPAFTRDAQVPGGAVESSRISWNESGTMAFWDSLSSEQKRAFRSLAGRRIFAAGARLMEEGEHADHVAVILSGLTEIRVLADGGERVVARRGPGELVGERAALHVSVRSAAVVAIQRVEALVMPTERFAAFVSDHPGVLDLMERQIFRRLREGPIGSEDGEPFDAPVRPVGHRTAPGRPLTAGPYPRWSPLNGQNCTVVHTDVAAFSAPIRNDKDREMIRQALWEMTRLALHPIWEECRCEDRGDGHLIIASPAVPTEQVIGRLLDVLPGALRRHNRVFGEPVRIQLRVAVDVGPVTEDAVGVSGNPIIRATRMLESRVFRDEITGTHSVLGIIVSPFVFDTAIQNGRGSLDPADYATVSVEVKETSMTAWMQLMGPASDQNG